MKDWFTGTVFVYTVLLLEIGHGDKRFLQQPGHKNDFRDSKIPAPQRNVPMAGCCISHEKWQQYICLSRTARCRSRDKPSHQPSTHVHISQFTTVFTWENSYQEHPPYAKSHSSHRFLTELGPELYCPLQLLSHAPQSWGTCRVTAILGTAALLSVLGMAMSSQANRSPLLGWDKSNHQLLPNGTLAKRAWKG